MSQEPDVDGKGKAGAQEPAAKPLITRQAAFIGVGSMVGAGIFALLGAAGATNAGLYPAPGVSERLAETRQFPPLMAHKVGGRASSGLLIQAVSCLVLVSFVIITLVSEPASIATLLGILVLAVGLDQWWKRVRDRSGQAGIQPGPRGHGVMKGAGQ